MFVARMGASPSALRKANRLSRPDEKVALALRLDYRAPYDWPHLLAFLRG